MARYPERRSAAIPALHAAQELHGWCSPEAIEQVACVMRVTPAYLDSVASFYDMLENHPVGRHSVYVCTNISCSLRGADALLAAIAARRPATIADFNVRAFECLGACDIAPMASVDGVYVGPLTPADVPQLLDDARAGRPVLPDKQLATRLVADPHANSQEFPAHAGRGGSSMTDTLLFKDIDEPGLNTLCGVRSARRLLGAAQGARDDARRKCSSSSKPPACAAAAAPASRWARRSRSCRRARWTSTSCATPTSPSPGRSRTAN